MLPDNDELIYGGLPGFICTGKVLWATASRGLQDCPALPAILFPMAAHEAGCTLCLVLGGLLFAFKQGDPAHPFSKNQFKSRCNVTKQPILELHYNMLCVGPPLKTNMNASKGAKCCSLYVD